ncbi:MAG: FtsX-like permease family protein [Gammaproteobacteria bacterium]|nr:FtsX-like permease family protein [Gammaproteobacteria bacterium]
MSGAPAAADARRLVIGATLWRASLRYLLRHPWQFGLSLVGIALGVAVVVAIDLSIESARRAFALSNEGVLGSATHQLLGGPRGIDESLYRELRLELPGIPAAPVVEGHVAALARGGGALHVLGVDPFAEAPFRGYVDRVRERGTELLTALLTRPGTVLASPATAARLGIEPGESFAVLVGNERRELHLTALLESGDELARVSLDDVLVCDIATAQELLGRIGRLSRIDLIVGSGTPVSHDLERLRELLPAGVRIEPVGSASNTARQMTRAFELNLLMLSLLAVVVGMFLVYNTVTFSVVQRRELIGILRATGVTRAQVFVLVITEACVVALAAALAGVGLGVLLAHELLGLVSRTINDLYFAVSVREVDVAPLSLAKGLLVGLVAAVIAALVPAFEATRVAPRAALSRSMVESRTRQRLPVVSALGIAALAGAGAVLWLSDASLAFGFVSLFAVVAGFALLSPVASLALLGALRPAAVSAAGWLGRLAIRGVGANLSRTAVAIAALMVALSAIIGVGVMVGSFRSSVERWLDATLRAEFYVGMPGAVGDRSLDDDLIARVSGLPGVAEVSAGKRVEVHGEGGEVNLLAIRMASESYRGFQILRGRPDDVWRAFDAGAVLVSEPYATHHGTAPGDRVTLDTEEGPAGFDVAGIYRDYGSEEGVVFMSYDTYLRHFDDPALMTLGVYAAPDADLAALGERLRDAVAAEPLVEVRANGAIKKASMEVFDRTFTVTAVLRMLAAVIAFVGVLSALMALELERGKEIAVLRAQGMTRAQVWGVVQTQTGVMGLIAGLLSLPVGLVMALVLILVINRRSFGWSMEVLVEPAVLVQAIALALVAALIAGVYPAWRMARIRPADALRED